MAESMDIPLAEPTVKNTTDACNTEDKLCHHEFL